MIAPDLLGGLAIIEFRLKIKNQTSSIKHRESRIENRASCIKLRVSSIKYRASRKAHLIFWPITATGLLLDLASKKAVFAWLETKQDFTVSVIDGFLQLVRTENPGAAFGIAGGQRLLLISVSIIALIIIFAVLFLVRPGKKLTVVALGLFTAGVLGNFYDRLFFNGRVRDFIDLYYRDWHWPAFNIADAMLCAAVALCIISMGRATNKPAQKPLRQQK